MVNKRNSTMTTIQAKKKLKDNCACKSKAIKTKAVAVKRKLKIKGTEDKKIVLLLNCKVPHNIVYVR